MKQSSKLILRVFILLSFVLLVSASCKKKRAFNEEEAQDTVDERITQGECDEVIKDVNTVVMEQYQLRGRPSGGSPGTSICSAAVDTSAIRNGIVVVSYDGTNCYGRSRTGSMKISIVDYPAKKWKHQGCSLKIELNSYKLTRQSDGKTLVLEGTLFLVNESGNTWNELWFLNAPTVVYRMTGDGIRATYNNDEFAKYNFDRRLTYTYSNNVTTCVVEGLGYSGGYNNLQNWGQARGGKAFTTEVTSALTWKTSCGSIAPISGQVTMRIEGKDHELKCEYAVDSNGNDVSGTDSPCPFGWKVTWKYKKKTNTRTFSYY